MHTSMVFIPVRQNSRLAPVLGPAHPDFSMRRQRCVALDFWNKLKMPAGSQLHTPGSQCPVPSGEMGRGNVLLFLHRASDVCRNWKLEVCK